MSIVVVVLMAAIGMWLWLYFAAVLWDGLGGRWAQKSARGRNWLQAQKEKIREKNTRSARDLLVLAFGFPYHVIWLHPRISLGVCLVLLIVLSYFLIA